MVSPHCAHIVLGTPQLFNPGRWSTNSQAGFKAWTWYELTFCLNLANFFSSGVLIIIQYYYCLSSPSRSARLRTARDAYLNSSAFKAVKGLNTADILGDRPLAIRVSRVVDFARKHRLGTVLFLLLFSDYHINAWLHPAWSWFESLQLRDYGLLSPCLCLLQLHYAPIIPHCCFFHILFLLTTTFTFLWSSPPPVQLCTFTLHWCSPIDWGQSRFSEMEDDMHLAPLDM